MSWKWTCGILALLAIAIMFSISTNAEATEPELQAISPGDPFTIGEPVAFINVTSPVGGATYTAGRVMTIEWNSSMVGTTVDIFLCQGDPVAGLIITIAAGTDNSGSYDWYVPTQLHGRAYYVRVQSMGVEGHNPTGFTIDYYVPSTLTFSSPIQNDIWPIGTTNTASAYWAFDNATYDVWLMRGDEVVKRLPSLLSTSVMMQFNWTVEDLPTSGDYHFFVARNGGVEAAMSPSFTIRPQEGTSMHVTNPVAGMTLTTFSLCQITWTDLQPDRSYKVDLYNSSLQRVQTFSSSTSEKSMDWVVYSIPPGEYRVYVKETSGVDGAMSGAFTIEAYDFSEGYPGIPGGPGWVSVNTAMSYVNRALVYVAFNPPTESNTACFMLRSKSPDLNQAISLISNPWPGDFHQEYSNGQIITYNAEGDAWFSPTSGAPSSYYDDLVTVGTQYYYWVWGISVSQQGMPLFGALAASPYANVVAGTGLAAGIEITSPTAGQVLTAGDVVEINWTSYGDIGDYVAISLVDRYWGSTIDTYVPNSGHYHWTIPDWTSAYDRYAIRIDSLSIGYFNTSGAFSVVEKVREIAVISPVGGESWTMGTTHEITWEQNFTGAVNVLLFRGASTYPTLNVAMDVYGDRFTWTIPSGLIVGDSYYVKVVSGEYGVSGASANFSILAPTIVVTSPSAGEAWNAGTTANITWQSAIIGNVDILLLKGEDATPVLTIATDVGNSGRYAWSIPATMPQGSDYRVRVRNASLSASGFSAAFTIVESPWSLVIKLPENGTQWKQGTAQPVVVWESYAGTTYTVRLLRDGNATVLGTFVATSTVSMFNWTITQAVGDGYRVSVTSANQTALSEGGFSIMAADPTTSNDTLVIAIIVLFIVAVVAVAWFVRSRK